MPDFVNTVDLIGDEALIDSIIERNITEFMDNRLTRLSSYAFDGCKKLTLVDCPEVTDAATASMRNCNALTSVNFPSLVTIGNYALMSCGLTTVDFPKLTSMGNYVFIWTGSKLKAVILRSPTMCSLGGVDSFTSTGISSGVGYIYVPRDLLDTYKAATNWSTYAAQFRALEDYTVDGTTTGELDTTKI